MIIVGGTDHRFLIAETVKDTYRNVDILLEPVARNSCAAIAAACFHAMKRSSVAMLLVMAADHFIADKEAFAAAVGSAIPDANAGHLVTFGIRPSHPATAYGYILPGEPLERCFKVQEFVEKPGHALAETYLEEGRVWNSGNFLFKADAFLADLLAHEPGIHSAVERSVAEASTDLDFIRLEETSFSAAKSISVDHAIMEKTGRAAVLPVDYQWSDIGSWDAMAQLLKLDDADNAIEGNVVTQASANNVIYSDNRLTTVVGMQDTIVVTTRDAVLVAAKSHAEDIKQLVDRLKSEKRDEALNTLKIFRPWGSYEQLDISGRYQVKRIEVYPGGVLSLQRHKFRAEHWVIVEGKAEVTIDDKVQLLEANQSIYVPLASTHRLANREDETLVLIEVQTGTYFGEDDIERFDDAYGRTNDTEPTAS